PRWIGGYGDMGVEDRRLRRAATTSTVVIFTQILVGATMRHTGAGLAIPDFPWMFGHLIPDHWSAAIAVHFAHRVGALFVIAAVFGTSLYVWRRHQDRPELARPATLIMFLVIVQVTPGALTVISRRDVLVNSLHVVVGALVLTTSLLLTLRSWRVRFADVVRLKPDTTSHDAATAVRSVRLQPDQALRADQRGRA